MAEDETAREETARVVMGAFNRVHKFMHMDIFGNITPKLKPSHFFVMIWLNRAAKKGKTSLRVSEIASFMGISVPGVTQLITGLEKDGYIRREMDPADRRGVRVFLTPAGEQMMAPALQHLENRFFGLIEHLGEANSKKLIELLLETERYFTGESGHRDVYGTVIDD